MNKQNKFGSFLLRTLSYILVAALASAATCFVLSANSTGVSKLEQLAALIEEQFIGESDRTAMEDAAVAAMVDSLGDRWSYYIPAADYDAHMEQVKNAYVGIGVTISTEDVTDGFRVIQMEPGSGAAEAGVQVGDVIVAVEGEKVLDIGMDAAKNKIRGEADSYVSISVLHDGQTLELSVQRKLIQVTVAKGEMLDGEIGLITIANFDERCADETLAAVQELLQAGAKKLIFDVRFNPGGYKTELVEILDRLLPEGALFRSLLYTGEEAVDESDETCLEMPMAVLVNGDSYSAAEFFAAALREYDWAVVVGQPTVGKSYFQNTFRLNDGSAVGLSVGKYFTPKGVSLADEGGLQPDVIVEVDEETAARIYADQLEPLEDPQILAAIEALKQ